MYSDLNKDGEIQTPEEILWEGDYYPLRMEMNRPWMDQADRESKSNYNGIEKVDNFIKKILALIGSSKFL